MDVIVPKTQMEKEEDRKRKIKEEVSLFENLEVALAWSGKGELGGGRRREGRGRKA